MRTSLWNEKDVCELSGVYVLPKNEMNDERSVAIPMNMAIAMMTKKRNCFLASFQISG